MRINKFIKLIIIVGGIILLNSLFACKTKHVFFKFSDNILVNYNNKRLVANKKNIIPKGAELSIRVNEKEISSDQFVSNYKFLENGSENLIRYKDEQLSYKVLVNTELSLILERKNAYLDTKLELSKSEEYFINGEVIDIKNFFKKEVLTHLIISNPVIDEKINFNIKIKKDLANLVMQAPIGYLFKTFKLELLNPISNNLEQSIYDQNSNEHFINKNNEIAISLAKIKKNYPNNFFYLKIILDEKSLSRYVFKLNLNIAQEIQKDFILWDVNNNKEFSGYSYYGSYDIPKESSKISLRLKDTNKYISKYLLNNKLQTYDFTAYQIDLVMDRDYSIKIDKDFLEENLEPLKKIASDFVIIDKYDDPDDKNYYYLNLMLKKAHIVDSFNIYTKEPNNYLNEEDKKIYKQSLNDDLIYRLRLNKMAPITKVELKNPRDISTKDFDVVKKTTSEKFTIEEGEQLYRYKLVNDKLIFDGHSKDREYTFSKDSITYYRLVKKHDNNYKITKIKLAVDLDFLPNNDLDSINKDPFLNFTDYYLGVKNNIKLIKDYQIRDNLISNNLNLFYKDNETYLLKPLYNLDIKHNGSDVNYTIFNNNELLLESLSAGAKITIKLVYKGVLGDKNIELINRTYQLVDAINIYNEAQFLENINTKTNAYSYCLHNDIFIKSNAINIIRSKIIINGNYYKLSIDSKEMLNFIKTNFDIQLSNLSLNLVNADSLETLISASSNKVELNNLVINNTKSLIKGDNIDLVINYIRLNNTNEILNLTNNNLKSYTITNSIFLNINHKSIIYNPSFKFNLTLLNNNFDKISSENPLLYEQNDLLTNKKILSNENGIKYLIYYGVVKYENSSNLYLNLNINNYEIDYSETFPNLSAFLSNLGSLDINFLLFSHLLDYPFTALDFNLKYPKYLENIQALASDQILLFDYKNSQYYLTEFI